VSGYLRNAEAGFEGIFLPNKEISRSSNVVSTRGVMLTLPSILSRVENDSARHGNGPSEPRRDMSTSGLDENDSLRMLRSMVPRRLDGEDILTVVERS